MEGATGVCARVLEDVVSIEDVLIGDRTGGDGS
jgi:hypothetical protein